MDNNYLKSIVSDLITCVGVLLLGEEAEGGDLGEGAAADEHDQDHPRPVRRSLPAIVPPPKVGRQRLILDHTEVRLLEIIHLDVITYSNVRSDSRL